MMLLCLLMLGFMVLRLLIFMRVILLLVMLRWLSIMSVVWWRVLNGFDFRFWLNGLWFFPDRMVVVVEINLVVQCTLNGLCFQLDIFWHILFQVRYHMFNQQRAIQCGVWCFKMGFEVV